MIGRAKLSPALVRCSTFLPLPGFVSGAAIEEGPAQFRVRLKADNMFSGLLQQKSRSRQAAIQ